ncbi:MAG: Clp1/GlmU family protein [Candidatus Methylomirabilales bacterium]
MDPTIQIVKEWEETAARTGADPGLTLVLGASDTGKTSFARYLMQTWRGRDLTVACVDGDIGQSTLGPPTTIGMSIYPPQVDPLAVTLSFVGHTSPHGHLIPLLLGLHRMVERAKRTGVTAILVDTTGLVHGEWGRELKFAKIDLLTPRHLVVLARGGEMEAVLQCCALREGLTLHRLPVAPQAMVKSREERRAYRQRRLQEYFREAALKRFPLDEVKMMGTWLGSGRRLPPADLSFASKQLNAPVVYGECGQGEVNLLATAEYASEGLFRLRTHLGVREVQVLGVEELTGVILGLNNGTNETLALGLLQELDYREKSLIVLTPLRDVSNVRLLKWGALRIDPNGKELGRYPPIRSP